MSTLLRPRPDDPDLSVMENTLELRRLTDISPNLFTNMRPLWHPPGARGVYGGSVIAQCLAAAQQTVPEDYTVHSMHCYFVLAGNADVPIVYHVERVRDGRSYATRTVQARQKDTPIFTTTLSFQREGSAGQKTLDHHTPIPDVPPPAGDENEGIWLRNGPFESQHFEGATWEEEPHMMRTRNWMRARGKISKIGGHRAHLNALAYMTDSFFIGTVGRAHRTWRPIPIKAENGRDGQRNREMVSRIRRHNGDEDVNVDNRPEIGIMVSLDHTIYFHRPRDFAADDWLLSEMGTPWAGDGRGFVTQRIWTKDGRLVASCFQEVRFS